MKKIIIPILILIILAEGYALNYFTNHPVNLGMFSFTDLGDDPRIGLITIKGTWTSDTKLGQPLQTTSIECWQRYNNCIETTAQIGSGNVLNVFTEYWEIEDWGKDEIRLKEHSSFTCVNYNMTIDRKNKTVVSVRSTKNPKPDGCEAFQDEPIYLHLTDGYKLGG